MNPRKAHWDEELQKDLEFVQESIPFLSPSLALFFSLFFSLASHPLTRTDMTENPSANQKKERMLSMHRDFVNTLSWFKGRLDTFAQELDILLFSLSPPSPLPLISLTFLSTLTSRPPPSPLSKNYHNWRRGCNQVSGDSLSSSLRLHLPLSPLPVLSSPPLSPLLSLLFPLLSLGIDWRRY